MVFAAMNSRIKDITGEKFGRLEVISLTPKRHNRCAIWLCRCDCGNMVEAQGSYLRNGDTQSCGCLHDEMASERLKTSMKTHGGYYDRLHHIWSDMLTRCGNPRSKAYPHYGGRGISVCKEWAASYQTFKDWAYSNGYEDNAPYGECTIDRIDVNGDYSPKNCRFVPMKEQGRNMTTNRNITIGGDTRCISEWANILGITPGAIYSAERFRKIRPDLYIK